MFQEVDPLLGPEMRSTGEVLGLATTTGEAFFKAQEAAGSKLPTSGSVLITVNRKDKEDVIQAARTFYEDGFKIFATNHTAELLNSLGIPAEHVLKVWEGRPNILDMITNGRFDIIVNSPSGSESRHDDSYIRKAAIKAKIPYVTTAAAGLAAAEGISHLKRKGKGLILPLQEWHAMIRDKD
jgi:carbamoyl-phosphate synthase large subunit